MSSTTETYQDQHRGFALAWKLLAIRLVSLLLLSLLIWITIDYVSGVTTFPPNTMWATLALLPVNIWCLLLIWKHYLREGISLREALGIRPDELAKISCVDCSGFVSSTFCLCSSSPEAYSSCMEPMLQ